MIESDYRAMEGMILGETRKFERVIQRIHDAETAINEMGPGGDSRESHMTPMWSQ